MLVKRNNNERPLSVSEDLEKKEKEKKKKRKAVIDQLNN